MVNTVPKIFLGVLPKDWVSEARAIARLRCTSPNRQRLVALICNMIVMLERAGYTYSTQITALTTWRLPIPSELLSAAEEDRVSYKQFQQPAIYPD